MIITDNETVNAAEDLIRRHKEKRPEKPRSVHAISARYYQAIGQYQELMRADVDNREGLCRLVAAIAEALPEPKKRAKR